MSLAELLGPMLQLTSYSAPAPAGATVSVASAASTSPASASAPVRSISALTRAHTKQLGARPIADLLRKRYDVLQTREVSESPNVEAHTCTVTCVAVAADNDPLLCICVASGRLHRCGPHCEFTRDGRFEACPLTGIASAFSPMLKDPDPKFDDRYGCARLDEKDPIGLILKNVRVKPAEPDAREQWRQLRGEVLAARARAVITDVVFSKERFAYDSRRLSAARTKLAETLVGHVRKNTQMGNLAISVAFIAQCVRLSAQTLEREGACLPDAEGTGTFDSDVAFVSERCVDTWMPLELEYEKLRESRGEVTDAERAQPLIKKASKECRKLAIAGFTHVFKYHVLAALYSTKSRALTTVLPSHAYLFTRSIDMRLFHAHKDSYSIYNKKLLSHCVCMCAAKCLTSISKRCAVRLLNRRTRTQTTLWVRRLQS